MCAVRPVLVSVDVDPPQARLFKVHRIYLQPCLQEGVHFSALAELCKAFTYRAVA